MPLFGSGESTYDGSQNVQLTSINQRLSTIEAYNAGNRLGVLETVNSAARLSLLEALDAGSRLSALESVPTPTLSILGAEPAGAETRAKIYTDTKVSAIVIPTLTSLGGEPAGAETRAKIYTDTKVSAIAIPTLTSLGGEPAGAETRAKAYTDQKVEAIAIPTLTSLGGEPAGAETRAKAYTDTKVGFPTNHLHIWGYGKPPSGKTFSVTTQTAAELGRYAVLSNGAIGDTVEYEILLKSGSYTLTTYGHQTTTRGIAAFYIDNSFIGAVDYYSSITNNKKIDALNFTVTTSGLHSIKVICAGKTYNANGTTLGLSAIRIDPQSISVSSLFVPIRINCGAEAVTAFTDSSGNVWAPNLYDDGNGRNYDLVAQLGAFTVAGTSDQTLYKYEYSRDTSGSFVFTLPIYDASRAYTLKLHFCENYNTSAGVRVGSVKLNGSNILSAFDIFAQAGGQHKALVKTFSNLSLSSCSLTFTDTLINGIELI
jgi:hypothetical protein